MSEDYCAFCAHYQLPEPPICRSCIYGKNWEFDENKPFTKKKPKTASPEPQGEAI